MVYLKNNKKVKFNDLEKSGMYSTELIEEVKIGNYNRLKKLLDKETRKNKDFMEPLLYAVKNENGTYAIYEYYDESLQYNINLATEIVRTEPELIEHTQLSREREFILTVAEINPKVVQYMDQELKLDTAFTGELCKLQKEEITRYASSECKMPDAILENTQLSSDKIFMMEAILQDVNSIEYLAEDLKNDYEFMKDLSKKEEVVAYVVEHIEQFNQKGLTGTKDALFEVSTDEVISGFEKERTKIKEEIANLENREQSEQLENLLKRNIQLQRHIKFFERIQKGEVDPVRAAKLIDQVCKNIDDKTKRQLKQFLKLDEVITQKTTTKEDIEPKDIEAVVEEGATMEGIKAETTTIRGAIEGTREEKGEEKE